MALCRQRDRQLEMLVAWSEMPRSPGHIFYDRLQAELVTAGFDSFAEGLCALYYTARLGRPSLPPGRYFRMLLVGCFEGIDSERGLEWRCADSLSLREFLRLGDREPVPDHSWLSRMAKESGIETPTAEDLVRLDRKRKGKRLSNAEWESPADPDARIAKLKDGRTHLAHKFFYKINANT